MKVVMTWSSYAYGAYSQYDQSLSWKQAIRGGEVGGRGALFKLHYDCCIIYLKPDPICI